MNNEKWFKEIFDKRDKALENGKGIVNDIFRLNSRSGILAVEGNQLRNYFQYQFNPEKGETANGELERWLEFIKNVYHIIHQYDLMKDLYYFKYLNI